MSWAKIELADYLNHHFSRADRFLMYDAGIVSYFSQRDFGVLGGFAGDQLLLRDIRNHNIAAVAERINARYIVVPYPYSLRAPAVPRMVFRGTIRTPFADFSAEDKQFVVFKGTPQELDHFWNY